MNILKSCRYILKDLDCAACGKKIEDRISIEEGYEDVNVGSISQLPNMKQVEVNTVNIFFIDFI